jgi:DUF3043 family protein
VPSLFRRKSSDLVTDAVTEANTRTTNGSRTSAARSGATKATGTKAGGAKTVGAKTVGAKPAGAKTSGAKGGVSKTTVAAKSAANKTTVTKATSLKSSALAGAEAAPANAATDADDTTSEARGRGYTASKKDLGQVTPKRKAGGRVAEPPPTSRREAYRRMRAKEREARVETRAGVMAGKEEYLPKRDQGPERSLVRDIVDSRHSVSRYFMPIALGLVLITSGVAPTPIRLLGNLVFYVVILGVIVDAFLLTRRLKRELTTRFPKSTLPPRSHYFYGIMRALSFRKLRMPAPKVKVGDKV